MIEIGNWAQQGVEIAALRKKCWEPLLTLNKDHDFSDRFDPISSHLIFRIDGQTAGAVRSSTHDALAEAPWGQDFEKWSGKRKGPYCVISRLVVDPAFQGQGAARQLIDTAISNARDNGAQTVFGNTSNPFIEGALLRRGFLRISDARCISMPPTPAGTLYAL